MKVAVSIWDKLTRVVIFLLFVSGLLGLAVWYLPLIKTNERYRKEVFRLDAKIQKEEEAARQLRGSIDSLRHPKAVERLVRESLGYAKPGETVIRFEASGANNNAGMLKR